MLICSPEGRVSLGSYPDRMWPPNTATRQYAVQFARLRFTIIIPVYNAADFLTRAVESAVAAAVLTGSEWELILIDNNSTDESPRIMESSRQSAPDRILTITHPVQGAPAARNAGLAIARGEWIQFLDADDHLTEDKLVKQWQLIDGSTDWIISSFRNLWVDGSFTDDHPHEDPWRGLVFNHQVGHISANLYRRSAIERAGGFNECTRYYDDPNLHLRLLRTGATYLIDPVVRSYYCHHPGERVTGGNYAVQAQQAIDLIVEALDWLALERPDYLRQHAAHFRGSLLRQIRILATNDLAAAAANYHKHFGGKKTAYARAALENVPRYTRLYPYLGFANVEAVRIAAADWLPPRLKRILKS